MNSGIRLDNYSVDRHYTPTYRLPNGSPLQERIVTMYKSADWVALPFVIFAVEGTELPFGVVRDPVRVSSMEVLTGVVDGRGIDIVFTKGTETKRITHAGNFTIGWPPSLSETGPVCLKEPQP